MLPFIIGVVLLAVGIGLSVMLHEAGHMWTAKMFGMRVRRFFVGFGPRIWSFRRGDTEYGLKAVPAGGFCDIAGMTALDEVTEEEAPRAMWRYAVWKRVVVMSAGSITHFILGFVVLYLMTATLGLPNIQDKPIVGQVAPCAQTGYLTPGEDGKKELHYRKCAAGDQAPARSAGMQAGDRIVSVAGQPTRTWSSAVAVIQQQQGSTPIVVQRGKQRVPLQANVARVTNVKYNADPNAPMQVGQVGAIGAKQQTTFHYGPAAAVGASGAFTGQMFVNVYEGIKRLPQRIPALLTAIAGGEREADTPISVVGASIIGGDAVQTDNWLLFFYLLAALNFFFGVFNLLPLLPMDGGHIAVAVYERIRNWLRRLRGLAPGGPVDYTKLAGLTMVFVFIGGAMMLLTITADIVNPIRLQ